MSALIERSGLLAHAIDADGSATSLTAPGARQTVRLKNVLLAMFLPARHRETVSADYLTYQLYDSLQAVASSLCGTFATRALLLALGVGNAQADIASATVNWIVRDMTGIVGRIVFGFWHAADLDCESKRFRLLADALNDAAILLDIVGATLVPTELFVPCVCLASLFRAIVGVAGPATKAAVSVHQARANNVADLIRADAAQETAVNLVGLCLSMLLVPAITSNGAVWTVVLLAIGVHLWANVRAMSAVAFDTFNRQRLAICMDAGDAVPTPTDVAERERFLLPYRDAAFGDCALEFGASLAGVVRDAAPAQRAALVGEARAQLAAHRAAVLVTTTARHGRRIAVCVGDDAEPRDVLRAFFAARALALRRAASAGEGVAQFDAFMARCAARGWRADVALIGGGTWRVKSAE